MSVVDGLEEMAGFGDCLGVAIYNLAIVIVVVVALAVIGM